MIYLKLYEQFNLDEDDPWGEDAPRKYTFSEWFRDKYGNRDLEDEEYDDLEDPLTIKVINCYNNSLTSLGGVENLINLKELHCFNNSLVSLDGIENLINLEWLNCSYNSLTSLGGVENLINLKGLYCSNNSFSDEYKNYLRNYCIEKSIKYII